MKKLLLFFLFFTSLNAQEQLYFGLGSSYMKEVFTSLDAKDTSLHTRFKIGYGDIKAYAVELSIESMKNSSKIFSAPSSNSLDGDKLGLNIELLKAFDFDIYLYPFVRAGFGTGSMDISRELQESLSYGSFNLGAGVFIPLYKNVDVELGYEYRSISYEAIDTIITKNSYKSNANALFFGFNARF